MSPYGMIALMAGGLALNVVFAFWISRLVRDKGYSAWMAFTLCFFSTPLGAILILRALPDRAPTRTSKAREFELLVELEKARLRAGKRGARSEQGEPVSTDRRWLIPWHPVEDGSPDDGIARELYSELSQKHVLYGIPARAIGVRQDCDDTLFELLDGSGRLAVVHLTFAQHPESDPLWPDTHLFGSWEDFRLNCMKPDHELFMRPEPPEVTD